MASLSELVGSLPAGRLQMELAALMGYGAAGRSVRLMWRFGVLDLLLPRHALHFRVREGGEVGGAQLFPACSPWPPSHPARCSGSL